MLKRIEMGGFPAGLINRGCLIGNPHHTSLRQEQFLSNVCNLPRSWTRSVKQLPNGLEITPIGIRPSMADCSFPGRIDAIGCHRCHLWQVFKLVDVDCSGSIGRGTKMEWVCRSVTTSWLHEPTKYIEVTSRVAEQTGNGANVFQSHPVSKKMEVAFEATMSSSGSSDVGVPSCWWNRRNWLNEAAQVPYTVPRSIALFGHLHKGD